MKQNSGLSAGMSNVALAEKINSFCSPPPGMLLDQVVGQLVTMFAAMSPG